MFQLFFWPEAFVTFVYLVNRLPTKVIEFQTSLEILSSHMSAPTTLTIQPRIFGCSVFVHIPNLNGRNLIRVLSNVSQWDMGYIKKAIVVIIRKPSHVCHDEL